jgi:hypothetical protein
MWTFFHVFSVCLNFRRWFVLCLVYIPYHVLVQISGDKNQRLGPNEQVLPEDGGRIVSETLCFK